MYNIRLLGIGTMNPPYNEYTLIKILKRNKKCHQTKFNSTSKYNKVRCGESHL
jgi:hypothetical protein